MRASFSFPTSILLDAGAVADLPEQLQRSGVSRPLLVTDPGLLPTAAFSKVREVLGGPMVFFAVRPNPVAADVQAAAMAYAVGRCDGLVGLGGGSALDVAKLARILLKRPGLPLTPFDATLDWSGLAPFVAIPTTAGTGSEVGRSGV